MLDSKHENEAVEQRAFADRLLLSKCDLVDEATLEEGERRIHAINESVPIRRTPNSEGDMESSSAFKPSPWTRCSRWTTASSTTTRTISRMSV